MIISFFTYLLQVSICSFFFYTFYHFALRKENFFQLNRLYLIGSVLCCLMIPFIQVPVEEIPNQAANYFIGFDDLIKEGITETLVSHPDGAMSTWTLDRIFLGIYFLGLIFFISKLVWNVLVIYWMRSTGSVFKNEGYTLIKTNINHPVFSWFNMIFWNSDIEYTESETQQIILHEQVHIKQKHSLDILFFELIQILLWINPFVYLFKRSLKETHEYIADHHIYLQQNYQIQYLSLIHI